MRFLASNLSLLCTSLVLASPGVERIEEAVAASWLPREVRVEWQTRSASLSGWEEQTDWQVSGDIPQDVRGPLTVELHRAVEPTKLERVRISGTARVFARVPTVIQTMPSGKPVSLEDIAMAVREITNVRDLIFGLPDSHASQHVAARTLIPGRPLTKNDLRLASVVSEGQRIAMTYRCGPIRITLVGRSLTAGAKGETIKVLHEDTHRVYNAVIRNEGHIEVIL